MKELLVPARRPLLRSFAEARAGIVLDFDGTLAPIVRERTAAKMSPRTTALLRDVSMRYPTAVLSGRAQADVAGRLADANVRFVVGNHGAEWDSTPKTPARVTERVHAWHAALRERLGAAEGVEIEDKRYSLAIHYRNAPERAHARWLIALALRDLRGVRTDEGKLVVNVLTEDLPDKGAAIERLRRALDCERLLYVGDDANDEPAFARGDGERLITVRVGRHRASRAAFYLRNRSGVDELLALLSRLRGEAAIIRPGATLVRYPTRSRAPAARRQTGRGTSASSRGDH